MQIQCPACKTRAQLPDRQEGAKVRCGSCGRVFVARAPGSRGSSKQDSSLRAIALVSGVVLVAGGLAYFYNRGKATSISEPQVRAEEPQQVPVAQVDPVGWDSDPVVAVRDLFAAVRASDAGRVQRLVDPAGLWVRQDGAENALAAEEGTPAEVESAAATATRSRADFEALPGVDQLLARDELVGQLLDDESERGLAAWNPVDGRVVSEQPDRALVHVRVDKLDVSDGLESRTLAFDLLADPRRAGAWRIAGWERHVTPEEQRASIARAPKEYQKVELSDGSKVFEAEPRPLEHLADTPPEMRAEIDRLYATLIDLDLTREASAARSRLIEIGRPAMPILLTGLYEIPLDTDEQGIQVNQIVMALRDITGQNFGYAPIELAGSSLGESAERRESSIKQWFAWWHRKGERFETRQPEADLLEGLIELNEREKRLLERDRRSGG